MGYPRMFVMLLLVSSGCTGTPAAGPRSGHAGQPADEPSGSGCSLDDALLLLQAEAVLRRPACPAAEHPGGSSPPAAPAAAAGVLFPLLRICFDVLVGLAAIAHSAGFKCGRAPSEKQDPAGDAAPREAAAQEGIAEARHAHPSTESSCTTASGCPVPYSASFQKDKIDRLMVAWDCFQ
mmetsp:Transcript_81464/g.230848  ORF Transcript_81464/g.230848 Transcript_81464/m.230848 type:complete len:179 (+) Transcript_81464:72-608(+)